MKDIDSILNLDKIAKEEIDKLFKENGLKEEVREYNLRVERKLINIKKIYEFADKMASVYYALNEPMDVEKFIRLYVIANLMDTT